MLSLQEEIDSAVFTSAQGAVIVQAVPLPVRASTKRVVAEADVRPASTNAHKETRNFVFDIEPPKGCVLSAVIARGTGPNYHNLQLPERIRKNGALSVVCNSKCRRKWNSANSF